MGEVGQLKVSVPKPRPLGLVKRESVHFDSEENGTEVLFSGKHDTWTRGSLALLSRSKTESDIKHEFRSMRDLQETLRQAALLNIVAAVNHDEHAVDTIPVAPRTGGSNFVGIKGASILGHPISRPVTKPFVSASTGEGISINNFSHNLMSTANNNNNNNNNMPTASHNSTLSQLLGQRPRTISIPRPRTQTDQGAFMHRSLLDAKEQLTNVTTFRAKSRKDMTDDQLSLTGGSQDTTPAVDDSKGNSVQGTISSETRNGEFVRDVSCLRGTGFDIGDSNSQNKHTKESSPQNVSKEGNNQNGDANSGKLSKEQQRAQNVQQMQAMKRHITTNKKKELMKKLTDIAKCDAVDIAEPMSSADAISAPPIIIMSQQKDNFPFSLDGQDTRVNRIKSMTSLPDKEEPNVPSNNRIQSETLESMANYREAKKKAILNVEEDLRIESINGIDTAMGVDGLYRSQRDQKVMNVHEDNNVCFSPPYSRADHFFSDSIIGKTVPPSFSPDVFELRPLEGYSNINSRLALAERRRPQAFRRSVNPMARDRLISPSPAVYEASFHKPKASMVQMTLVGQSLPSLSGTKTPVPTANPTKPASKRASVEFGNTSLLDENRADESLNKQWEGKAVPVKPWGSVGKQPSVNSPILRTEIVDHLQCVGLVNHRQVPPTYKKSVQKVNNVNKGYGNNKHDFEFDDEEYFDDDDSSDGPPVTKNTAKYRKSKLYNAFRASEENLSTLADNTSLVSDVMTGKTLFIPQPQTVAEEPALSSARDPVHQSAKEPLYMGCSSRVSEKELRSRYHYVNDPSEEDAKPGGQFKVMKAIDQDVYFDFQHKKYRKNNEIPLNTAPNNPRMHFLKIKFGSEAKT